ncbi:MAG: DUF6483 family protein [Myxococcota bacterium]|nr:DUF6483 family protein [Myxococcota bacterium]
MFRQDVLLRQIEQFAAALARIKASSSGEPIDLHDEFEAVAANYLETTFRSLLTTQLTHLTLNHSPLEVAMAADLIAAHLFLGREDDGAMVITTSRAIALYRYAFEQDRSLVGHPTRAARVDRLLGLASSRHNLATAIHGFYIFEYIGRFDRAEDRLFELIDRAWTEVNVHGRQFYGRLLALSDETLEQGGLPRQEVIQGRHAFELACQTSSIS